MSNVQALIQQVQHAKVFLDSAEAALSAPRGTDAAKADAAHIVVEEAGIAIASLLNDLDKARTS